MSIRPEDKEAFRILADALEQCRVGHWPAQASASEEEIQRRDPIAGPAEHGVLVWLAPPDGPYEPAPQTVREWVFIDGSPRTLRGRDALINGVVAPLFTAEVAGGSAALRNGHWEAFERAIQRYVLVPQAQNLRDAGFPLPRNLPGGWLIEDPLDVGVSADIYDEVCAAALRKTRWLMRRVERELALHLVGETQEEVVADGPLADWRPLGQPPPHDWRYKASNYDPRSMG